MTADASLRGEIDALYARYAELLDEGPLADWPALFHADAVYKVVTRENAERGWPVALLLCEGRAAIEDRVHAVENLMMTVPRRLRHVIGALRIAPAGDARWNVGANFAAFESIAGRETRTFAAGRYRDVVARGGDGTLRFAEKVTICDGDIVLNSLVVPL